MTKFLKDRFNDIPLHLMEIQRAHRSPTMLQPAKTNPRPIIVAFLRWEIANDILFKSPSTLKNMPYKDPINGQESVVYVEQLHSPKVSKLRQQASKVRRDLKDKNPRWPVFLRYPAKMFVKRSPEDTPVQYNW